MGGRLVTGLRRLGLGTFLVVAAAALWGCWSIVFRSAEASSSRPLSAATETAVVFFVMLLTMAPLAIWTRRRDVRAGTAATRPGRALVVVGVLGVVDACNALCFFEAMQRTTVAIAVLCHYLTPVIVALLSPVLLGEPRRRSTLVALALSLAGLVLLLQPWGHVSADDVEGAALASLSAVFYAASLFLGKTLVTTLSTWELAAWPKLTSVPILIVAAVLSSGGLALEPIPGLILVAGGIVCGALPLWLFYVGLARLQASQVSVLTLVEPLVAVLVGVLVWGEPLAVIGIVGGALVLVGAGIIARAGASDAVPS
jgi:drug/metabolite transporter (DMT)-like permease